MSTARLLQSYFAAKVSVSRLVTIIGPAFRGLWRETGNDRFAQHAPLSSLTSHLGVASVRPSPIMLAAASVSSLVTIGRERRAGAPFQSLNGKATRRAERPR